MEEQQKFEVSQEPQAPKTKGSKKGLLIVIVVALIAAIAAGVYFFFFNDSTKLQLTAEDKVTNSADKVEAKVEEIFADYENVGERKIAENMMSKPFSGTVTVTGKINKLEGADIDATMVNQINQMINGQNITVNFKGNLAETKLFADLAAAGQKIGEVVLNKDAAGVKVEGQGDGKYMAVFKNTLEQQDGYEEVAQIFDMVSDFASNTDFEKYEFTSDEKKHFSDTYGKIFKDNMNKDAITSESTEITVDGKNVKCDKVTYTITPDTAKTLIKAYLTAVKNDTEGQDILLNKVEMLLEDTKMMDLIAQEAGMTITVEQLKSTVKQQLPTLIDELSSEVDSISGFDKIDLVVYATATTTHRIEAILTIDGQSAKAVIDLKNDGLKASVVVAGQELGYADITNKDKVLTIAVNVMEMIKLDITNKIEDNGNDFLAKLTANVEGETATVELGLKNTVNEDTENKLDENLKITLKGTIEEVAFDLEANIKSVCEIVDSVDVPEINSSNSVDVIEVYNTNSVNPYTTNTTVTPSTSGTGTAIDTDDLEELEDMMNDPEVQQQLQELQQSVPSTSLGL